MKNLSWNQKFQDLPDTKIFKNIRPHHEDTDMEDTEETNDTTDEKIVENTLPMSHLEPEDLITFSSKIRPQKKKTNKRPILRSKSPPPQMKKPNVMKYTGITPIPNNHSQQKIVPQIFQKNHHLLNPYLYHLHQSHRLKIGSFSDTTSPTLNHNIQISK